MPKEVFRAWKAGDPISARRLNEIQKTVQRIDGFLGGDYTSNEAFAAYRRDTPVKIKLVKLDKCIGPDEDNSSEFHRKSATVQWFNYQTRRFEDTSETVEVSDPTGAIHDEGDVIPVFSHWSGQYLPLEVSTVRHAVTVRDDSNYYPPRSTDPDTYPIKFVRLEYTEAAGRMGHTLTYLSDEPDPDDFVHNIIGDDAVSQYIPEGALIWAYRITSQWWTYICCEFDDSSQSISQSSRSSSSKSSSKSSSSTSSASSKSSSSTSSRSMSSASSVSSESSSRGSSASSSSTSSSGGSSGSSSSSSRGSSASSSSRSSRGSSNSSSSGESIASSSSGYDCVTVVTSLAFDPATCDLTYCTREICFPKNLGVVIGAENC